MRLFVRRARRPRISARVERRVGDAVDGGGQVGLAPLEGIVRVLRLDLRVPGFVLDHLLLLAALRDFLFVHLDGALHDGRLLLELLRLDRLTLQGGLGGLQPLAQRVDGRLHLLAAAVLQRVLRLEVLDLGPVVAEVLAMALQLPDRGGFAEVEVDVADEEEDADAYEGVGRTTQAAAAAPAPGIGEQGNLNGGRGGGRMEGSARAKKVEGFSSLFDRSRARRGASSGRSRTHVSVHVASAACVYIRVDPGCVAGDGRGFSSALSCDPARRVASFPRSGRSNLPPAGLFARGLSGRLSGAIGDRAVTALDRTERVTSARVQRSEVSPHAPDALPGRAHRAGGGERRAKTRFRETP